MHPTGAEVERSLFRSHNRRRVLIMLSSLGEAHPNQLARASGVESTRIRWMMHGHLPQYSPDLSLIPLGLVNERFTPNGQRLYVITTKGRRKARSLTARQARSAERRAAVAARLAKDGA